MNNEGMYVIASEYYRSSRRRMDQRKDQQIVDHARRSIIRYSVVKVSNSYRYGFCGPGWGALPAA